MADNKQMEISDKDLIFKALAVTSLKTVAYLFVLLIVLAVFICQCFPFSALKFYYSLGDYPTALVYADNYLNMGGAKADDALLYGMEMSDYLFYKDKSLQNAQKVQSFSARLAASKNFDKICVLKDEYYNSAANSTVMAVGLFSYKDFVYSAHAQATSRLGQNRLLYSGGFSVSGQSFIEADELEKLAIQLAEGDYIITDPTEFALILNQLSATLAFDAGLIYSGGSTTLLYDYLARNITGFDSEYNYFSSSVAQSGLLRLYLLDAAANFQLSLTEFFGQADDEYELDKLSDYFGVGEGITLADFYAAQLSRLYKN